MTRAGYLCLAVLVLALAALFLWTKAGGWLVNVLMAAIMLACILGEDTVNGIVGLRQILPASREVNATFRDSGYVHRAQSGESWWPYSQIRAAVETADYFVLLSEQGGGQVYDKKGFSWGSPEEFKELIRRKTGQIGRAHV